MPRSNSLVYCGPTAPEDAEAGKRARWLQQLAAMVINSLTPVSSQLGNLDVLDGGRCVGTESVSAFSQSRSTWATPQRLSITLRFCAGAPSKGLIALQASLKRSRTSQRTESVTTSPIHDIIHQELSPGASLESTQTSRPTVGVHRQGTETSGHEKESRTILEAVQLVGVSPKLVHLALQRPQRHQTLHDDTFGFFGMPGILHLPPEGYPLKCTDRGLALILAERRVFSDNAILRFKRRHRCCLPSRLETSSFRRI